ncbi:MAG: MFS transporter [Syntrophales bacterium]
MLEQEIIIEKTDQPGGGSYRWLTGLVNFFLSFATMSSFIFVPLLGAQLGASDFEVGIVGAAYGIAFLFSSLISGWKSDHLGRLVFVRWGLLMSSVAFAAQLLAHSVPALIVARAAVGFALGIAVAATITYAFECGANMGKYSSYGSLGWIFGAAASSMVGDIELLFWLSFIFCLVAFFISLAFQKVPTYKFSRPPNLWLVMRRDYRVYLAVFLRHLGASAVWVIFPLYLVSIGLDHFWIGLLWGVNFVVQFLVMRQLERFSEFKTFFWGQVLSIFVFLSYAFFTSRFSLVILQVVLGVAWSCLYVGALLIVLRGGKEKGTAGGIFQSTLNLCNAVGPILGGLIAQGWGYRGVMLFAAALCVGGMFVTVPARPPASHT